MRKEELHAKLVDLPELAVIGKQGLCTPESNQANDCGRAQRRILTR